MEGVQIECEDGRKMWFRDSKQAFNDAIGNGILSNYKHDENYAGRFMYMYSEGIQDCFKHIDTRQYLRTDYIA